MPTLEKRRATVIGKTGWLHTHLVDELGKLHWLTPSQFDAGAKAHDGAKVCIEHRTYGWHVLAPRIARIPSLPTHPPKR